MIKVATDKQLAEGAQLEADERTQLRQNGAYLLMVLRLYAAQALDVQMRYAQALQTIAPVGPSLASRLEKKHRDFVARMEAVTGGEAFKALRVLQNADAVAANTDARAPEGDGSEMAPAR